MATLQTLELPIRGMDCAECTQHVRRAIARLPGVESVEVLLSSEKAVVRMDPALVGLPAIRQAVAGAGDGSYSVAEPTVAPVSRQAVGGGYPEAEPAVAAVPVPGADLGRRLLGLLAVVFGAVLFVIVLGEWLGLLERLTERVPFPIGLALVVASGWPIFRKVARSTIRRQVTSHTLMTLGALAALAVGQWATAAVVVFFMRVGEYTERLTTEGARRAVKDLTALAPPRARVERSGVEVEVPLEQVAVGEIVIVRPGEVIPVDGAVVAGRASVDQAAITGEPMPLEAGPGSRVFAASLARLGGLKIRATRVGPDTTFGRVVKLVEQAEANRGEVQRFADRFSGYYLPLVTGIAAVTFLITRNPLSTAAVLVVACSCSIALATPIAMLASVGAAAKQGLLIKGGKYLETLARADVLLVDKTGTLTLGRPQVTEIVPLDGQSQDRLLQLAASAERYSEHPLAEAVRAAARSRGLQLLEPDGFRALPGRGGTATLNGDEVAVGNREMLPAPVRWPAGAALEAEGKSLLYVACNGRLAGLLAATDTLRPEVPEALAAVRRLGVRQVELLTGDNERTAADLAKRLGMAHRANLLPEDKIEVVRSYQAAGHTVVMVGDGVNDAPALAQADVGIAMGAAGSDIAIQAAHVAVMREDWSLVAEAFRIARRTMGVVKTNLAFTAVYNVAGLTLAALGVLPPILAASAQSLPDLGILTNSSRLLRRR
jgi:Cd2+/Zn2+-exporting ATPase/Cu+-exporting ATPase